MAMSSNIPRRRIAAAAETTVRVLSRPSQHFSNSDFFHGVPFDAAFFQQADEGFGGVIPFLGRIFRMVFQLILLLTISVLSYQCFFYTVMPTFSATVPLFFDYTGTPAPFSRGRSQLNVQPALTESQQPSPWALADLFARHSSWEPGEVEDVVPPLLTETRLLVPRQAYFVEVSLNLPESKVNEEAGVFGVVVEIKSYNGTALATSRRTARFPHQTRWIRTLQKILLLFPLLAGAWEESRTIWVPSYRHIVESLEHPIVSTCPAKTTAECTCCPSTQTAHSFLR
jgi:hypothetical protein